MRPVIFAGPSLDRADARRLTRIDVRPPVASGDLFALRFDTPPAIGILDGWFGDRRAIGHKEILWIMARGARVFGAASLGALRAAELDAYGMTGIGDVYRMVKDGRVTDDGDVAVLHGPAEIGFQPLTVALVDVLATLDSLSAAGRIDAAGADALLAAARGLHFTERTWAAIAAATTGGPSAEMLAGLAVPRKRLDALALIEAVASEPAMRLSGRPVPPPMTLALRRDLARAGRQPAGTGR